MTRAETLKILMTMQVTYPNYKVQNKELALDIWADMLSEYTYQQVALALKTYITTDTSGFAPSIGQLVDKIQNIMQPCELNEMEAWNLVSTALRNGYYGAEAEFDKLPPVVQKAVGSAANLRNWSQTNIESVENVIQSNFMRTYRAVLKREKEYQRLPERVRLIMSGNLEIVQKDADMKLEGR